MAIIITGEPLIKHKQAMYLAQDAVVAQSMGKEVMAIYKFEKALEIELEVLNSLRGNNSHIETFGIILRSAASLAMNCRQYEKAMEIIRERNQYKLSDQINTELDEIVNDIEAIKQESNAVTTSDGVMIIESNIPQRYIMSSVLNTMFNLSIFDGLEHVRDYFETHKFPGIIIFGLHNTPSEDLDFNRLIKLLYDYQLAGKVQLILISADSYDEYLPSIAGIITTTCYKPYNPVDLRSMVSNLLNANNKNQEVRDLVPTQQYFGGSKSIKRIGLAKRLFDIIISTIGILLLLPVFLLIALAIRIESKGPILYVSPRAGRFYKIFKFYKFRTMEVIENKKIINQSPGLSQKINLDPRITKVGRFLRNTSLDELPQLFNVLKGDMSLVGNRPLPLYEASQLTTDKYAERFMAASGMTGLWQIKKRGTNVISTEARIELDITYSRKESVIYDLGILLKTPGALFAKKNA